VVYIFSMYLYIYMSWNILYSWCCSDTDCHHFTGRSARPMLLFLISEFFLWFYICSQLFELWYSFLCFYLYATIVNFIYVFTGAMRRLCSTFRVIMQNRPEKATTLITGLAKNSPFAQCSRRSTRSLRPSSFLSICSTEPQPRQVRSTSVSPTRTATDNAHRTRGYVITTRHTDDRDLKDVMTSSRFDLVTSLAIPRPTSTLPQTRIRPGKNVRDIPGLGDPISPALATRRTRSQQQYELAYSPTQIPHARASSTRRNGYRCMPSPPRDLLVYDNLILQQK